MSSLTRRPAWSEPLTRPLSRRVRPTWRPATLVTIKAVHTVIFASVGAAIALLGWDGIRQCPGRRAAYALGIAMAETGIYVSNNWVCPLTPLAEDLGAERGAVADMFLPGWAARSILLFGTAALVLGVGLNVRAMINNHRPHGSRREELREAVLLRWRAHRRPARCVIRLEHGKATVEP
jgi:hypothetical protein